MSFIEGRHTEHQLKKQLESFGIDVRKASKDQNINDHIDLILNDSTTIDVKGLKKLSRHDFEPTEHFHYVEIKNVNGDKGWIFGKADFIVFETLDFWIFVRRTRLVKYIRQTVDFTEKTYRASSSHRKLYSRKGRKDLITLVKTIDLCYLSEKIIKKDK